MLVFDLGALLTCVRIAWYGAVQAWSGLRGLPTITHFGTRAGVIARIYGVFYTVVTGFLLLFCQWFLKSLIDAGFPALAQKLLAPFRLEWNLVLFFFAFGFALLALFEGMIWLAKRRVAAFAADPDRQRRLRSYLDRHALVVFGFGALGWLGLPSAVALAAWLVFVYTLPPEPS
jgi:hypothetical protein